MTDNNTPSPVTPRRVPYPGDTTRKGQFANEMALLAQQLLATMLTTDAEKGISYQWSGIRRADDYDIKVTVQLDMFRPDTDLTTEIQDHWYHIAFDKDLPRINFCGSRKDDYRLTVIGETHPR